jgi:rhomboid-like protein
MRPISSHSGFFSRTTSWLSSATSTFRNFLVTQPTTNYGGNGGQRRRYARDYYYYEEEQNPNRIIYAIIGVNLVVFVLWQNHDIRVLRFMKENFVVSYDAVRSGRIHTLLTATYSQQAPMHLFTNMLTLWFIGGDVVRRLGMQRFFFVYTMVR